MSLILIDFYVSYIPLALYQPVAIHDNDIKYWGMIDAVRGSEKDATELS